MKKLYITIFAGIFSAGALLAQTEVLVEGNFTVKDDTAAGQWVSTEPLLVVGNGTITGNESNALVVLKNGDTEIKGKLKVLTASEGIPMGIFGMQN